MLVRNLSHNMRFLKDCEIIVVNDDPSESIQKELRQWNNVILIENRCNMGFGLTVNKGVTKALYQYIMLLNSDVLLQDTSYTKAFSHFETDSSLFAVSFAQKEKDGSIVGKNRIFWKNGFLQHEKANSLTSGHNGWAEGGACIIDRKKFDEIKGFDPLFSPFYWEDIDLSYRAWKRGYSILFDSRIVVEHHHESTIGVYFSKHFIKTIAFRNQLICIWKNITSKSLLYSHIPSLFKQILTKSVRGDFSFLSAFLKALFLIVPILKSRKEMQILSRKTDEEILHKQLDA